MRLIIYGTLTLLFIVIGIFIGNNFIFFKNKSTEKKELTTRELHSSIKQIGNLELIKLNTNHIVEYNLESSNFFGYKQKSKVLLIVAGESSACIDLQNIDSLSITEDSLSWTITLPEPFVCFSKVDLGKSKIYDADFDLLETNKSEIIQDVYKEAESDIEKYANQSNIKQLAKGQATSVLKSLLESLTEKEVRIAFASDLKESELKKSE